MTIAHGAPYASIDRTSVATVLTVCALLGCCLAVFTALPLPLALLAAAVLAVVVLATWRATRRLDAILREEAQESPLR